MDHKLQVTVQVALDASTVRLNVGGCLTGANCVALFPLIRRAQGLLSGMKVTVDTSAAGHIEPAGLDVLHRLTSSFAGSADREGHHIAGLVEIVVPATLPSCAALRRFHPVRQGAAA